MPREDRAAGQAQGGKASVALPPALLARAFAVMTRGGHRQQPVFNFTTNGNGAAAAPSACTAIVEDPGRRSALLLAVVYALASLAQLVVGRLIDRIR